MYTRKFSLKFSEFVLISFASFRLCRPGSVLQVTVEDLNIEAKKMVLSAVPRPDVRAFVNFPEEKWIQAVIQNVNSFGIFVRPAGYDAVGMFSSTYLCIFKFLFGVA